MSILPPGEGNSSWYAVQVRSQSEFKILRTFREKLGLNARIPARKVWKRKNGQKFFIEKPLLTTYVFVCANLKRINWRLLFSPSGVFGIVRQGGVPAPIPEEQIFSLEKLCESDFPVYEIDYQKLGMDDRVEVVDGPLRGAVGNFLKHDNKTGRFVVALDLFRRTLVTELEADLVRPF